jgi:hypothetical protein
VQALSGFVIRQRPRVGSRAVIPGPRLSARRCPRVGLVGFVIAAHNPALADPVYCSTSFQGYRTCSSPRRLLLIAVVAGAMLWAISAHAQKDIHNGPVAIRPMVTAPSLMGKPPPRPKIVRCADERAQLKQTLQAALDDKENHRGTPAQIRARWREADKALAASTIVVTSKPTDCDEAWESASEYVLGE